MFRTKIRKPIENIPNFPHYFLARITKITNIVFLLLNSKNVQSSVGQLYVSTNKLLKIANDIICLGYIDKKK